MGPIICHSKSQDVKNIFGKAAPVDRQGQHTTQRKATIGLGDFENKPSEMSNKTGFRIPVLSMVHVTSHSSAFYLATLPFYDWRRWYRSMGAPKVS